MANERVTIGTPREDFDHHPEARPGAEGLPGSVGRLGEGLLENLTETDPLRIKIEPRAVITGQGQG